VQQHPYLPIQNVPESFHHYVPTGIEIMLTFLPIAGVLLIITIIAKLFPVMPVWEIAHEKGVDESMIK
jgi:molybdopterin-containing oxidoreductase family membrane subunit